MLDLTRHTFAAALPMRDAVARFDALAVPFAAVVDADGRYVAALTEQAVRRHLTHAPGAGANHATAGAAGIADHPVADAATDARHRLDLMAQAGVDFLPIVGTDGRLVAIESLHALLAPAPLDNTVVIMAGGRGTRLLPVTQDRIPKPLVPLGPRPLVETTLERLRDQGFRRFVFCLHHLGRPLMDHFGDGARLGIAIDYLLEDAPLGTAGGLAALAPPSRAILVINGDILTHHDVAAMVRTHERRGAAATVAVRPHVQQVPFGVVEVDEGGRVRGIAEKPVQSILVLAGMYVLSPATIARLRRDERRDMTSLLGEAIAAGETVLTCPVNEYWLDVGTPASYNEALEFLGSGGGGRDMTGGVPHESR